MLRLMHCADLHIDSPFSTCSPEKRREKKGQLLDSFNRMIELINREQISVCLIAGDLFDTAAPSAGAVEAVRSGFAYAPGCHFFIAPGNHDPYTPGGVYEQTSFSENVTIFKEPQLSKVYLEAYNAEIYGFAFVGKYMEKPPALTVCAPDDSRLHILTAHGDLSGGDSDVCPLSEPLLRHSGFDYVALGHLHNWGGLKKTGGVYYGYSGCLCGRDFGETGPKGAYLCELSKQAGAVSCNSTFVPLCSVYYAECSVDISGCETDGQAAELVEKALVENSLAEGCEVRVHLKGQVPAGYTPSGALPALVRMASCQFIDETLPLYDINQLKEEPGLRGEFLRALLPALESGAEQTQKTAALALRYGLHVMNGGNVSDL